MQDSNNNDDEDYFTDGSHSVSTAFSQDGPSDQDLRDAQDEAARQSHLFILAEHAAHFLWLAPLNACLLMCVMPCEPSSKAIECSEKYAERFVKGLKVGGTEWKLGPPKEDFHQILPPT